MFLTPPSVTNVTLSFEGFPNIIFSKIIRFKHDRAPAKWNNSEDFSMSAKYLNSSIKLPLTQNFGKNMILLGNMFKWQDSASKVSEAEDVQVFQTYNNNDEFYTKESINTLLETMMKMSFVKIIFDKFSPRGVNDIFTDVITRTKTAIIDVDGHYDLGRAQLRKLFEKVPGGNIKRLQLNNVHFPLIIATSINSRVLLVHPGAQRNIHWNVQTDEA